MINAIKRMTRAAFNADGSDSARSRGDIPDRLPIAIGAAQSSIVQACIVWIADTIITSPMRVYMPSGTQVDAGTLPNLLVTPNDETAWSDMLQQVVSGLLLTGRASFLYADSQLRVVRKLPNFGRTNQARVYYRRPGDLYGRYLLVPRELVMTLPYRVDEEGRAYTPLDSVKMDLMTDFIRAWRTGSLLENESMPSAIISPHSQDKRGWTQKEMEQNADRFQEQSHYKRGRGTAFNKPINVTFPPGTNLRYLDMRAIAWIVEERACAVMRVSPDVAKLGVGLEQTKVGATMHESVLDSWRGAVRPMQRRLELALSSWLPVLTGYPAGTKILFDNSRLAVLQEEEERMKGVKSKRLLEELRAQIITSEEYRAEMYPDR